MARSYVVSNTFNSKGNNMLDVIMTDAHNGNRFAIAGGSIVFLEEFTKDKQEPKVSIVAYPMPDGQFVTVTVTEPYEDIKRCLQPTGWIELSRLSNNDRLYCFEPSICGVQEKKTLQDNEEELKYSVIQLSPSRGVRWEYDVREPFDAVMRLVSFDGQPLPALQPPTTETDDAG